jgi:anion-transporting  ArsA/GET3 family ATPase
LHQLHDEGDFDLIVVDTPPTRHALDFLDAPKRLTRLLDNRVFRLLMMPTRAYLRVASVAVQTFLRTVSRVVGSEVIEDVVAFFRAFEGMEEGFRMRAQVVDDLLTDPDTAFVLVCSPRRDAMEDATFFAKRLSEAGQSVQALIVNRVHPSFGDEAPAGLRAAAEALRNAPAEGQPAEAPRRLAALYDNLADFREIAALEREHIEALRARIGGDSALAYVPYLAHDVHDFATLHEVGELLFDTVPAR